MKQKIIVCQVPLYKKKNVCYILKRMGLEIFQRKILPCILGNNPTTTVFLGASMERTTAQGKKITMGYTGGVCPGCQRQWPPGLLEETREEEVKAGLPENREERFQVLAVEEIHDEEKAVHIGSCTPMGDVPELTNLDKIKETEKPAEFIRPE